MHISEVISKWVKRVTSKGTIRNTFTFPESSHMTSIKTHKTPELYNAFCRSYEHVSKMSNIHRCYTQRYIFAKISHQFHNDLWRDMGCKVQISEVISKWVKWVTSIGAILKKSYIFGKLSYEFHNDPSQDMGSKIPISEVIRKWVK